MTNRASTWFWNAMSTISVISALAGCAGIPNARNAGPQVPGTSDLPDVPDKTTRSMHVDHGRLGFDHTLQVRRSKTAVPYQLHDGDTVMTGDRIRASVVTSENAYLYLAFCTGHELALYPSQRGVHTSAGDTQLVPEGSGELVIDGGPGSEVLYLILSRTQLSLADPHLADAITASGQGPKTVDCGASLDAELAKPAHQEHSTTMVAFSPTTKVLRGSIVPRKRMPAPHSRNGHGPSKPKAGDGAGSSSDKGRLQPVDVEVPANAPDEPDFIRNPGTMMWYGADGANGPEEVVAADADGIAVVRYRFTHVAPSSPP